ncbi:MAG: hypothetical protein ACRDZ9_04430 [Acidimicrobiales bacterium]
MALEHLVAAGAVVEVGRHKIEHYPVDAHIVTPSGGRYLVAPHGNFDEGAQPGLRRPDKVAQRAVMLHAEGPALNVATSHLPKPGSAAAHHLADRHLLLGAVAGRLVATTGDFAGFHRLRRYFAELPRPRRPSPAPWWHADPQLRLFGSPGSSSATAPPGAWPPRPARR